MSTLKKILKYIFGVSGQFSANKIVKETGITIFEQSMLLISHSILLIMRHDQGLNKSRIEKAIIVQRLFASNALRMNIGLNDEEIGNVLKSMNKSLNEMEIEELQEIETGTIIDASIGLPPVVNKQIVNYLMVFFLLITNNSKSQYSKFKEIASLILRNQRNIDFEEIWTNAKKDIKAYNLMK